MLAEERYARIVAIIKVRGFAKVGDLAKRLGVTEMTIRRDLEKCQENGLLQRCHGGAVIAGVSRQEIRFEDKSFENIEEKRRIARTCASFVTEGMSVFLDAGTTAYEIAQRIRIIPRLTIVTNDVHIMESLLGSDQELLLIGGAVQKSTGSVIGQIADQMIERLSFDIAFLGASSINKQMEVMTPTVEKAFYKRIVLSNSKSSYLVVDNAKFYSRALYRINSLSEYTGVVTDRIFSEDEQKLLDGKKVRIISPAQTD